MSRSLRRGLVGAGMMLAALSLWAARVVVQSRAELHDGESLLASGDVDEAVEALGRAARLAAPGNPWSRAALDRLEELATDSESRDGRVVALVAWRQVRSSLRGTRALWPREQERERRADWHIARLAAALESPSVDPGADEAARVKWHAARLAQDDAPSPTWSLLALVGLCTWVGCAFGLFTRGLDERLRWRRGSGPRRPERSALALAVGVALGFTLFLVALARA